MKKINILTLLVFSTLLSSCAIDEFYQIVDVSSDLNMKNRNYSYTDGVCEIIYDFWAEGGDPGFYIHNHSDKTIYVDLEKCFYIRNDKAYDYYQNRTFTSDATTSFTEGISATASAYGVWRYSGLLGNASSTKLAKLETKKSKGVSTNEKKILAIPPHTYKTISEFRILTDVLQDCDIALFPSSKKVFNLRYDKTATPISFSNIIVYKESVDGPEKEIKHDFYVSGITNYQSDHVFGYEKGGCGGNARVPVMEHSSPCSFYIKYDASHTNSYSKDNKSTLF